MAAQDGGDPFNYQDDNLGWLYRTVAAGHNHTVGLIQVGHQPQIYLYKACLLKGSTA